MGEVTLESPLLAVLGSGAKKLAKARDLVTVRDLLDYFPRRYIDAHAGSTFGEFELGEHVVLTARVETMTQRRMQTRKGSMANAVIVDDEGRPSLMSAEAVHELGLEVGALAVAVVKATSVIVETKKD